MKRHQRNSFRQTTNRVRQQRRLLLAEPLEPRAMLTTFLVTSNADDETTGTLRTAILAANANSDADEIHFQGALAITLASPLPTITAPVQIDGFDGNFPAARPNASLTSDDAQIIVEINGGNTSVSPLVIQASNCVVRGLAIFNTTSDAIRIESGSNNRIEGNYIGVDKNGSAVGYATLGNGVRVQGATSTNNIIGTNGDGTNDLGERNVIVHATLGVAITGATDNVVAGNFIGTGRDGTSAIGNVVGIILDARADRTRIGTDAATPNVNERNVISGNSVLGIGMARRPVLDSDIYGNYIGTTADGTSPLANGIGVAIEYGAERITIGGEGLLANRIAYNTGEGVLLTPAQTPQNPLAVSDLLAASPQRIAIRGNEIHHNGRLGIDLVLNGGIGDGVNSDTFNNDDNDLDSAVTNVLLQMVNGLRNRPTLTLVRYGDATRVQGTLESQPNETYTIDFYANNVSTAADAEGEVYLGKTTIRTDATGAATFDVLVGASSANQFITATATSQYNETSEFSAAVQATVQLQEGLDGSDFIVLGGTGSDTVTIDPGAGGTVNVTHNSTTTNSIAGRVLIAGFGGVDTINVNGNTANGTFVDAGDGSDIYNINFADTWTGNVVLQDAGASGTDIVNFNGTAEADQFNKQFVFVDWNLDATPTVKTHVDYVGMETKNVFCYDGNDIVLDPGEDTHIFGGLGNDTITIDATSGSGVTVDGGGGSDTYLVQFGNLAGPVVIADTGTAGTDSVHVVGTAEDDDFAVTSTTVTSGGETVQYSAVDALAVSGGAGNDSVVVQSTSSAGVAVDGGDGTDDVSVVPGASGPVTVADTGTTGDNVISLQGTAGNDLVTVTRSPQTGEYVVRINQNQPFRFRDLTGAGQTTRLVIDALAGNDRIVVDSRVLVATVLMGNAGNDILQGGGGHNLLLGGPANDILWGGANDDVLNGGDGVDVLTGNGGRDILIGGDGVDILSAGAGEDLLIGGGTAFDANQAALLSILAEWSSPRTYAQRVANLTGTGSGASFDSRLNGSNYLLTSGSGATIVNDNDADVLFGGAGRDKFFVSAKDIAADRQNNE